MAVSLSLQDSPNARGETTRLCVLMLTKYIYGWTADSYVPLPSMPKGLSKQLTNAKKALKLINKGKLLTAIAGQSHPAGSKSAYKPPPEMIHHAAHVVHEMKRLLNFIFGLFVFPEVIKKGKTLPAPNLICLKPISTSLVYPCLS